MSEEQWTSLAWTNLHSTLVRQSSYRDCLGITPVRAEVWNALGSVIYEGVVTPVSTVIWEVISDVAQ